MNIPPIGFIGLGVMGKPMARNPAKAGYKLAVYDREKASAETISGEFEQVRAVESPKTRIQSTGVYDPVWKLFRVRKKDRLRICFQGWSGRYFRHYRYS
jgi:6-phosphogluconate dehydrogenase (decarboxylating)